MAALVNLTVPVDPEADPLDLVQSAIVGSLTALDVVDGVTFGGAAGAIAPASRQYSGTIVANGQTINVSITTERTA